MITLASREFLVLLTFLRFFQRACGVCAFLASSGSHGVVTPPLLPTLTVYSREVPLLGFRLMWRLSGLLLRSAAVMAVFFPSFAIFALIWGLLFFLGIVAFIPRLHFWCCLFCSVCLFSSSLSPTVASLVCFSCRPPSLVIPVYVFGVSFCGGGAVSSSSPPAGCGVGSC